MTHQGPHTPGRRWCLLRDWTEIPSGRGADAWTAPEGTVFTYVRDVAYLDWFAAIVTFDDDVKTRDGRTIPAGTELRTKWGITKEEFSVPVTED